MMIQQFLLVVDPTDSQYSTCAQTKKNVIKTLPFPILLFSMTKVSRSFNKIAPLGYLKNNNRNINHKRHKPGLGGENIDSQCKHRLSSLSANCEDEDR
jgi:hypothetical protein